MARKCLGIWHKNTRKKGSLKVVCSPNVRPLFLLSKSRPFSLSTFALISYPVGTHLLLHCALVCLRLPYPGLTPRTPKRPAQSSQEPNKSNVYIYTTQCEAKKKKRGCVAKENRKNMSEKRKNRKCRTRQEAKNVARSYIPRNVEAKTVGRGFVLYQRWQMV